MDAHAEGSLEAMTVPVAGEILRRQGMPPEEVRAVLTAADPVVVRRLLELHRERLGEWLEEQRRLVVRIEDSLTRRDDVAGLIPLRAGRPWAPTSLAVADASNGPGSSSV
jgi:hypothetical protein